MLAFPFETITNATRRTEIMNRVLTYFISATPGTPDLISDTGNSTDNITRWNNSDDDHALTFTVSGTVAGSQIVPLTPPAPPA